jgi:hypothetical protein
MRFSSLDAGLQRCGEVSTMTVMVASCWSRTQQLQVHGDDSGHMRRRRKIAGEDHATGTARVRSFWIRGPAAGNVTARSHDGNREKKRCETCADIWGRHSVQLADVTWRSCPMLREKVKALASGSLEKLPTMATPPWSKAAGVPRDKRPANKNVRPRARRRKIRFREQCHALHVFNDPRFFRV